jgi:hypothetical protein
MERKYGDVKELRDKESRRIEIKGRLFNLTKPELYNLRLQVQNTLNNWNFEKAELNEFYNT